MRCASVFLLVWLAALSEAGGLGMMPSSAALIHATKGVRGWSACQARGAMYLTCEASYPAVRET